jgi:hypothetical protein
VDLFKISLKIPKTESEAVNCKRADNEVEKGKETKGQIIIYKTRHRKKPTKSILIQTVTFTITFVRY